MLKEENAWQRNRFLSDIVSKELVSERFSSVSSGFGRDKRLLTAESYQSVFNDAQYKVSQQHFLILARSNKLLQPRLGIVVAKKNIKLSVSRNRIKRVVRNTFRLNQQALSGLDIIFLARKSLDELSSQQQTNMVSRAFNKLSRKACDSQSAAVSRGDGK